LLTETYNPGPDKPIDYRVFQWIHHKALYAEPNNTILNLIQKARGPHSDRVVELFSRSDMSFSFDRDWCAYLYQNGIIAPDTVFNQKGDPLEVCRFSAPFIQERLYNALTDDLVGDRLPILALSPLDDLADVFSGPELDLPALLTRYKDYLKRLKANGLNPWKDQPRRADLHLTEAVGHFHLYAWLKDAVEGQCVVCPEFPTGNGKVDLHLRCGEKRGIVEIKSFKSRSKIPFAAQQASRYAQQMELSAVVLVLFAPVEDEDMLEKLSSVETIDGVEVSTIAIGWA
jgi:hypothetical protein